jgi:hypothetical protein
MRLQQVLKQLKWYAGWAKVPVAAVERYLTTGDRSALARIKPSGNAGYWVDELTREIAAPPNMTDEDRRGLHVVVATREWPELGRWLDRVLPREKPDEDYHAVLRAELGRVQARTLAALTLEHVGRLEIDDRPTSAGRYLLALPDKELTALVKKFADHAGGVSLLKLCLAHAPARVPLLTGELLRPHQKNHWLDDISGLLLRHEGHRYEKDVVRVLRALKVPWQRFDVAQQLVAYNPTRYVKEGQKAARDILKDPKGQGDPGAAAGWLVKHCGAAVRDDLVACLRKKSTSDYEKREILEHAVEALGREAVPVALAALESKDDDVRFDALSALVRFNEDGSHDTRLQAELTRLLEAGASGKVPNPGDVVRHISLAARWQVRPLAEHLWALLEHRARPVRDAAARALAQLGEEALPRARELLQGRRANTRLAAVTLLGAMNVPAAAQALEARLDEETDDDVRDAMLLALESAWAASGRQITRQDVEARVARTAPKLSKFPVAWLKEINLPPLFFRDGGQLDRPWVRYLLYRQARAREIRPDVEARPLVEMLDRQRGGDFALAVLRGFLASKQASEDRWALTVAGLLGDDRVVPLLSGQARQWAEGTRGKMAEYAVQALALVGTDAALLALDAMSMRFRSKNKNVGQAAVDAFAAAAERLGITPDELGDRVVPWLGFEPGKARVIDCGDRRFEVRIGTDCKLKLVDLEKNKPVASLPKNAPKEVQTALKEQAATLREVVKAQLLRLENLMVRQHRWPVGRWRELFLTHPVLLPFAVRLVWGAYDTSGKLGDTFRALEDRSLTDVQDNAFTLPATGSVGIVHPLELGEDVRESWRAHLADYEIQPPFPQLERPVVHVQAEQRGVKMDRSVSGTTLNGMTFRGRAERLGWRRGAVADAGSVTSYCKSFPLANLDVFVDLDGMFMGMDLEQEVTLRQVYFVRGGSVHTGSYTYDEPDDDKDPRLVPFGEVPPIVFSEAIGDLGKIAGQKTARPEMAPEPV